jgi:hypothetical protein
MGIADRARTMALRRIMVTMAKKKVEHTADKGGYLTLDEVAAWVQDALRSGASGSEPVRARVNFSGTIKLIGVDVDATVKDGAP